MTRTPSEGCWPNTCGVQPGCASLATCIQRASYRLRSIGACQSATTRSFGSARFAHTGPCSVSMRQISEDTPPVSGLPVSGAAPARPNSRSALANSGGTAPCSAPAIPGFEQLDERVQRLVHRRGDAQLAAAPCYETVQMVDLGWLATRDILRGG